LSVLAARYRVEVRDDKGRLITVLEDDSKSFTQNFMNLLVASHYNQNNAPTLVVYDVLGNAYYTGYTASPNVGVPFQLFNIDFGCWSYFPHAYYWAVPAIWLGTSPCANPALANGPCGSLVACCVVFVNASPYPLSPSNLNQNAPCDGIGQCSPSLANDSWTLTVVDNWLNISSSPVTVASMALVFGLYDIKNMNSCSMSPFYAAIVDNLPTPVTVSPGWYITTSYTIYFPV